MASSPREWGCFCRMSAASIAFMVFPTRVGVFPDLMRQPFSSLGLPHASGGVSCPRWPWPGLTGSSPREWGCFCTCSRRTWIPSVFPTRVGVFPKKGTSFSITPSLPHASGGVSVPDHVWCVGCRSSPREWGCFSAPRFHPPPRQVFPTRVGVFPWSEKRKFRKDSLPHASGGVSPPGSRGVTDALSSPREWGCFRALRPASRHSLVFPTRVGVFP